MIMYLGRILPRHVGNEVKCPMIMYASNAENIRGIIAGKRGQPVDPRQGQESR